MRGDVYYISRRHVRRAGRTQEYRDHRTRAGLRHAGMALALRRRYRVFANTTLVVEPIAQLVAASGGGNPRGLPNEDSTSFEFDATNLFSPNPSPGPRSVDRRHALQCGCARDRAFAHGFDRSHAGRGFPHFTAIQFRARLGPRRRHDRTSSARSRLSFRRISLHRSIQHRSRDGTLRRNEVYLRAPFGRSIVDLSYLKLPPSAADPTLGRAGTDQSEHDHRGLWRLGRVRRSPPRPRQKPDAREQHRDQIRGRMLCGLARLSPPGHRDIELEAASSVVFRLGLKTGFTRRIMTVRFHPTLEAVGEMRKFVA